MLTTRSAYAEQEGWCAALYSLHSLRKNNLQLYFGVQTLIEVAVDFHYFLFNPRCG